jgi:hypothetical protein
MHIYHVFLGDKEIKGVCINFRPIVIPQKYADTSFITTVALRTKYDNSYIWSLADHRREHETKYAHREEEPKKPIQSTSSKKFCLADDHHYRHDGPHELAQLKADQAWLEGEHSCNKFIGKIEIRILHTSILMIINTYLS